MTLQVINNGSGPGDSGAETVYAAFAKAKANFAELYGIYGSEVEAFTFTTRQDDLAVADYTRVVRWNGAGSTGITGIAAPASYARVLTIVNASTDYLLWLENENTASAAANRLMLPDGFAAFLLPGDTITLWYDGTTQRWRVLSWPTRGARGGFDQFHDGTMFYSEPTRTISNSGTGSTVGVAAGASVSSFGGKGIYFQRAGTTSTAYCHISNGTTQVFMTDEGPYFSGYRVSVSSAPDVTDDFVAELGVSNRLTTQAFTYGAQWQLAYSGGAARWAMQGGDNSTIETLTTNAPAVETTSTGFVELFVFVNPAGTRADFLKCEDGVNVVLCASSTRMIASPAPFGWQECMTKTAGSNARDLYVDWRAYRAGNSQVRP